MNFFATATEPNTPYLLPLIIVSISAQMFYLPMVWEDGKAAFTAAGITGMTLSLVLSAFAKLNGESGGYSITVLMFAALIAGTEAAPSPRSGIRAALSGVGYLALTLATVVTYSDVPRVGMAESPFVYALVDTSLLMLFLRRSVDGIVAWVCRPRPDRDNF